MSTLMVTWTAYLCVGAVRILGVSVPLASFPDKLKPLMAVAGACRPQHRHEVYDPARAPEAWTRLAELGPAATLSRCRPMSCTPVPVHWRTEPLPQGENL